MFQFLRRVSGSFLPRPDRPWRDDATSHAPTIGRKRRHSVTEQDGDRPSSSAAKRSKNGPLKPDAECNSESGGESHEAGATPPAEVRGVKAVTKGVKEVDLEGKDKPEDASSIRPEGVPLPDSPSGSPEPQPEPTKPDEVEEEHADDEDSVASSAPEDSMGEAETDSASANTDASADEIAPAQEVAVTELHDTLETVEVKT